MITNDNDQIFPFAARCKVLAYQLLSNTFTSLRDRQYFNLTLDLLEASHCLLIPHDLLEKGGHIMHRDRRATPV